MLCYVCAAISNRNSHLNRVVRAFIIKNDITFNSVSDTVANKLLPLLDVATVVEGFKLKKLSSRLNLEHFQTFLYRVLVHLLEYTSLDPPKGPSQARIRQVNQTRFNVTVEQAMNATARGPADMFDILQDDTFIKLIQNKLDGKKPVQDPAPSQDEDNTPLKGSRGEKQREKQLLQSLMTRFTSVELELLKASMQPQV
jgi:hypothetical protein